MGDQACDRSAELTPSGRWGLNPTPSTPAKPTRQMCRLQSGGVAALI